MAVTSTFRPLRILRKTAIPISLKKTKTCPALPASQREARIQTAISQDFDQVLWEGFHICHIFWTGKCQREDPNLFRAEQEPIYRKSFNVTGIQSILCGKKLNTGSVATSLAQEAVMCKVLHPDHVVIEQFFHPLMSFGLQLPLYGRNRSSGREEAEHKNKGRAQTL